MKISILTLRCAICLRDVLHTAEIVSVVCCTPLRSSPQCVAHRRDFFCGGFLHTAEVFLNLEPLTPQYVAHHGDCLCGVLHNAELISAVCGTPLISSLWCAQRSSPRYVTRPGDFFKFGTLDSAVCCTPLRWSPRYAVWYAVVCCTLWRWSLWYLAHRWDILSGVLHTAQRRKNFVIEYLNKIKTDFENTLACLSEAHICSNHRKKTGGRKSRDTLPLTLHGC